MSQRLADAPHRQPKSASAARQPYRLDRRLDAETVARLVGDYESGISSTKLTQNYQLSKPSVLKLLHQAGVRLRREGLSVDQIDQATTLYESGLSVARVAERLSAAPTTVYNALSRAGVPMRPRNGDMRKD